MKSGLSYSERADAATWMTTGVIAMMVAGFALWGPFELNARSFLLPAASTVLLAAAGWFYRSIRHEARLGAILSSTAHIIAFAAVAAPLSYIAATAGFPLQDATLEAWDRSLGFEWREMLTFVASRPLLQNVLLVAYSSFAVQTVTTVLALGIAGQLNRLSTFIGAFVTTTLVIIAASAVYPAAGPWLFFNIHPESANGFRRRRRIVGRCSWDYATARCIPSTDSIPKESSRFRVFMPRSACCFPPPFGV